VAADGVSVVEDSADEGALLDVQIFQTVKLLSSVQLVKDDLLERLALEVEHRDQAVVVALVTHDVIAVSTLPIHVQVLDNEVIWLA